MKQADIIKSLAQELGTKEIAELNKLFKAQGAEGTKFKIRGKKWGSGGSTIAIKGITDEGLKIFDVNRVVLVPYKDIESIAKAKPKVARPEVAKAPAKKTAAAKAPVAKKKLSAVETVGTGEASEAGSEKAGSMAPRKQKVVMKKPSPTGSSVIPEKFRHSIRNRG